MEPEGTQEVQVPSSENPPSANGNGESSPKKWPYVLIVLILVLLAGGAAYFFGFKNRNGEEPTPTPTPEATLAPTLEPETSGSPTPTKKPTSTPTPKPTATPTPTPTPATQTMTLSAASSLDGFQSSNGGGNAGIEIRAGRNVNLITRGFVSFDISGIPTGKTIEEATLRLYQTSVTGNPYGVGSSLKVDHLDYGSSFENADYSASSLSSSFGTLTSNATLEWKDLIVTDRLKADISSGRTRSQYRLHFAIENQGGDVTGDFANFESANNSTGSGNTPQLVVKYH